MIYPELNLLHDCTCIYSVESESRLYILNLSAWHHHSQLHTRPCLWVSHSSMSLPSPTSPLSLNSNSDGSTDLQYPISAPNPPTQSPVTPLLDGGRSDHSGVPHKSHHSCYFDALKFGVGSRGGHYQCPTQPEPSAQFRASSPPRLIPIVESPSVAPQPTPTNPAPHSKILPSTEKLYACCLLGKI